MRAQTDVMEINIFMRSQNVIVTSTLIKISLRYLESVFASLNISFCSQK